MDLVKEFGRWLLEDGKSPKTVESYCNDVKQFQKYVQQVNEDALLTRYLFVRYKQYLMDENFATSTINKKVNIAPLSLIHFQHYSDNGLE